MADQDGSVAHPLRGNGVPEGEADFRSGTRDSFSARALKSISRRLSAIRWRMKMASFGEGSYIQGPNWVVNPSAIEIGQRVSIWRHARIEAICSKNNAGITRLKIGDGTAIQPYVHIGAAHQVTLGKHVMIASSVYITDHDHDLSDPMDPPSINSRLLTSPVHIGDYTWLGEKVMVLKGVTIGERSVIGAGSVVTRDIPPLSIAIGSPAKVIRRYDQDAGRWLPCGQAGEGW